MVAQDVTVATPAVAAVAPTPVVAPGEFRLARMCCV